MLELSMLFFTISAVAPAFGPLAAGAAGTMLSVAEWLFVGFLAIGAIGAAYHKPLEGRILHHA